MRPRRDYYEVLSVRRTATRAEIKRAFHLKARELHPDVNPSADAEERFKELNQAYYILIDPLRRSVYDRMGATRPRPAYSGQRPYTPPTRPSTSANQRSEWHERSAYTARSSSQGYRAPDSTPATHAWVSATAIHLFLMPPLWVLLGLPLFAIQVFNRGSFWSGGPGTALAAAISALPLVLIPFLYELKQAHARGQLGRAAILNSLWLSGQFAFVACLLFVVIPSGMSYFGATYQVRWLFDIGNGWIYGTVAVIVMGLMATAIGLVTLLP